MVADVAHMLHTPISEVLEWDYEDLLLWHEQARRIARLRGL